MLRWYNSLQGEEGAPEQDHMFPLIPVVSGGLGPETSVIPDFLYHCNDNLDIIMSEMMCKCLWMNYCRYSSRLDHIVQYSKEIGQPENNAICSF